MGRPEARCGTDAGYYRHRRKHNEKPCAECRAAHSIATRRAKKEPRPKKVCACGKGMHWSREMCTACTQKAAWAAKQMSAYTYTDDEHDPKRPVAWRLKGAIRVPVYEQSEVA